MELQNAELNTAKEHSIWWGTKVQGALYGGRTKQNGELLVLKNQY